MDAVLPGAVEAVASHLKGALLVCRSLDRITNRAFCITMGLVTKAAILAALFAGRLMLQAQQVGTNGPVSMTNSTVVAQVQKTSMSLRDPAAMGLSLGGPGDTNSLEYVISRTKVHVSGPLVRPMKAKSASDLGRRVLHLVSPFSDESPNLPPGAEVSGPVNTRAWSTIVGWSPGRSAFPDDSSHEPPQIRLISVSTEKLPKEP